MPLFIRHLGGQLPQLLVRWAAGVEFRRGDLIHGNSFTRNFGLSGSLTASAAPEAMSSLGGLASINASVPSSRGKRMPNEPSEPSNTKRATLFLQLGLRVDARKPGAPRPRL
jgi:hypothetical protein